nr:ASCH/PUA domain-containing protein [Acutalibacter muris]
MKIIPEERRKNLRCYFCGDARSVKYSIKLLVAEPVLSNHYEDVCCCNKCAITYGGICETTIHRLKTWPRFFSAVCDGTKTFEIRKNDRGFQVGDILELQEWLPDSGYTGRVVRRKVTYILYGGTMAGLDESYVVMAIK